LDYLEKKDYNYAITDSPPLSVIQHYVGDNDPTKKNIEKSHVVHTFSKIKRVT
jgi:hypothetical protein